MTEIKNIWGETLFSYDENTTTLRVEISKHKDLRGADLSYADLRGAYLIGADLRWAYLIGADLRWAVLNNANLSNANLSNADLTQVDLLDVNLSGANLSGANLSGSDLKGADLSDTFLIGADLSYAMNIPYIDFPMACPENGSFIGWKKVNYDYIVKLEIPEDAKRSSATSDKCRCDKAKVLEITNMFTGEKIDEVVNTNYARCTYRVGEMAYPDSFDMNRWNECSHGIHFFVDRDDAEDY